MNNESGIYYCLNHALNIMRKVPDPYKWGEHIEKIPEHCVNAKCGRAGCRKVNRDYLAGIFVRMRNVK